MRAQDATSLATINWVTVQFPEDHHMLPSGTVAAPNLSRSILDIGDFTPPRKLPLLHDILTLGSQITESDYLIYTNVDIALQPHFYTRVAELIHQGFDAFTINRRTIGAHYRSIDQLEQMYTETGETHRGWDCFVFKAKLLPKMQFGYVCIGAPFVGLLFMANLMANAENFVERKYESLTFHLGNDRNWNQKRNKEYAQHNKAETLRLLQQLETQTKAFSPNSPPGKFLARNRTPLRAWIYDQIMKIHIPAKYTRRNSIRS
jgi:hypothetical protein